MPLRSTLQINRRIAPIFSLAISTSLIAPACTPAPATTPTKPTPVPCTVTLAADATTDLDLQGSSTCNTHLTLSLLVATGDPANPTYSAPDMSPVRVGGSWSISGRTARRTVTVTNDGTSPVQLVGLQWSSAGTEAGLSYDRMLHQGYQSWSYTGVLAVPPQVPKKNGAIKHGGDNEDLSGEVDGVSWWWTFLAADASNLGMVLGADGATVFKTYIAAEGSSPTQLHIVEGITGDSLMLSPGETRSLDGLYLSLGDIPSALDDYASLVAERFPLVTPPADASGMSAVREGQNGLGGWGSWNLYYAQPQPDSLRMEMQWAQDNLLPAGLGDFLLDDGYETHWGSWQASPGFGVALGAFNAEQAALGLSPAVWLAPFYISSLDANYAAHPDWFVHLPTGEIRDYDNFGPTYGALDVSNPDARAFVVAALQGYRDAGYKTLKIDFLFGAAVEGVRQQPMTGIESFARWMKVVREAVPELHLVGCGAPLLPSVGWVDSMRTGADIALSPGQPEPDYRFISAEARHSALRAYTDHFWALDPDVVLLRGTNISDDEAFATVVSDALAGGSYLLGDGRQATALRRAMALDPAILAIARTHRAARPADLTAQIDPRIFASPFLDVDDATSPPHHLERAGAHAGDDHWLALFAWAVDSYTEQLQLPPGAEELLQPTTDGAAIVRKASSGAQSIVVPYHAVRLFHWAE